jgi:hypothetical protein
VTSPEDGAYIRGAAVNPLEWRRLRRVLIAICLTALAAVALILTVDAARHGFLIRRLETRGQPVQVTVTRCLGLASGTGITPVGYTCRGTFTLQGHRYDDVIRGSTGIHPVGQTLPGITDPRSPRTLFTARAVATAPPIWHYFLLPAILFALLLVGSAVSIRLDQTWQVLGPVTLVDSPRSQRG